MADLSKLSPAQLEGMLSMNLGHKDKRAIRAELKKRSEAAASPAPGMPTPTVDPMTGQPTGGAPEWMTNLVPSAAGVVDDTLSGLGQLAKSPVETLSAMPAGIAEHYSSRYSSPEQALQTFQQDPAGVLMDVVPVGGVVKGLGIASKAAGAGKAGNALKATGAALERLDPVNLAVGTGQTVVGRALNKWDSSPEAAMASNYYGAPVGSQVGNIDQYLSDIGGMMDEGITNKPSSQKAWNAKVSDKGAEIGGILEAGPDVNPQAVIGRLEDLKKTPEYAGPNDAPKRAAIDNVIAEIEFQTEPGMTGGILDDSSYAIPGQASTPSGRLSSTRLNDVKSKTQANAKYEVGSASESMAQEASKDAARILRDEVVEANPSAAAPMREYGQMLRQKDILDRGIAGDVAASGGGIVGDFMAKALNMTAPIMTGQGKMTRMSARRQGVLGNLGAATAITPVGYARELGYLADMEEDTGVQIPYRTGRLSD